MEDIFVQKMHINKVRHLENIEIEIGENERKHLILTGKNGSGKTSVLEGIRDFLKAVENIAYDHIEDWEKSNQNFVYNIDNLEQSLKNIKVQSEEYDKVLKEIKTNQRFLQSNQNNISKYKGKVDLDIKNSFEIVENYQKGNFILTFFDAKRVFKPIIPENVEKINLPNTSSLDEKTNSVFIKYLVDLDYKASRAYKNKDNKAIQEVESWFKNFTILLRGIFENNNLEIKFVENQNYNFQIHTKEREPFDLTTLSDGYASILNIITELILRMENKQAKNYDIQGIVLIDEIETHLHIDLQKKILPFLTTFFPKIQFIVTTHSPFVLSSISNAVIYDLEKKMRVEDLSAYAIDGIVEGYFESDKYSAEIKEKVKRYEDLLALGKPTLEEQEEILDLKNTLSSVPEQLAPELVDKFLDLELSQVGK